MIRLNVTVLPEKVTYTDPVYEYDHGRVLYIAGTGLTAPTAIHWALDDSDGKAEIDLATYNPEEECLMATVPDHMLRRDEDGKNYNIWCFIYKEETDAAATLFRICIPVTARPMPDEPVPTPEEESIIEQAIAALSSYDVTLTQLEDGYVITVTNINGTESAELHDGEQGDPGPAGVGIASITYSGTTMTITMTDGTEYEFEVSAGGVYNAGDGIEIVDNTIATPLARLMRPDSTIEHIGYPVLYTDEDQNEFFIIHYGHEDPETHELIEGTFTVPSAVMVGEFATDLMANLNALSTMITDINARALFGAQGIEDCNGYFQNRMFSPATTSTLNIPEQTAGYLVVYTDYRPDVAGTYKAQQHYYTDTGIIYQRTGTIDRPSIPATVTWSAWVKVTPTMAEIVQAVIAALPDADNQGF